MVFARVAEYLNGSRPDQPVVQDARSPAAAETNARRGGDGVMETEIVDFDLDAARPPYLHAMLAGGLGGTMGDMLMHSLDTVKTRQQGDPHMPPKYTSMAHTYRTIWRQEGVVRGLYSGVTPAFIGSFGGTFLFFGAYEWSKRTMLDHGVTPSVAYLTAGFFADAAASPLYVPTEVLKTRLQLQGRYKNPFFHSGYNYRSTFDALKTIVRREGLAEMFSGYKATLSRDLPFSALQFAFYEKEQQWAKTWMGSREIGLPLELLTGASAGGMAGVITCPLDVVKTRIQTQLDPSLTPVKPPAPSTMGHTTGGQAITGKQDSARTAQKPGLTGSRGSVRHISTGGASTSLRTHGSVTLDTESVIAGLRAIYKVEGLAGWFRGVGPRLVWTSIQSGTMLVMYQTLLKWFDTHPLVDMDEGLL